VKIAITTTTSDWVLGAKMTDRAMLFDSGVWIAAHDAKDARYRAARELVFRKRPMTAALDLTLYEIANVVIRRWRNAEAAAAMCRSTASRCERNFVRFGAELAEVTAEIAIEHSLTAYDAAYVAVARRHDWTLVSTDVRDLVSRGLAITPDAAV
jgi:predicted nucleic acid-binding protein